MKLKDQKLLEECYNTVLLREDMNSKLDKLQLALDVAGVEPTVGMMADGANALISSLRAAASIASKNNDKTSEHIINAGISVISLFPFADVVKLLKLRKLRKPALHVAKAIKFAGKTAHKQRAQDSIKLLTLNNN
jgi:hypothetical protein